MTCPVQHNWVPSALSSCGGRRGGQFESPWVRRSLAVGTLAAGLWLAGSLSHSSSAEAAPVPLPLSAGSVGAVSAAAHSATANSSSTVSPATIGHGKFSARTVTVRSGTAGAPIPIHQMVSAESRLGGSLVLAAAGASGGSQARPPLAPFSPSAASGALGAIPRPAPTSLTAATDTGRRLTAPLAAAGPKLPVLPASPVVVLPVVGPLPVIPAPPLAAAPVVPSQPCDDASGGIKRILPAPLRPEKLITHRDHFVVSVPPAATVGIPPAGRIVPTALTSPAVLSPSAAGTQADIRTPHGDPGLPTPAGTDPSTIALVTGGTAATADNPLDAGLLPADPANAGTSRSSSLRGRNDTPPRKRASAPSVSPD